MTTSSGLPGGADPREWLRRNGDGYQLAMAKAMQYLANIDLVALDQGLCDAHDIGPTEIAKLTGAYDRCTISRLWGGKRQRPARRDGHRARLPGSRAA